MRPGLASLILLLAACGSSSNGGNAQPTGGSGGDGGDGGNGDGGTSGTGGMSGSGGSTPTGGAGGTGGSASGGTGGTATGGTGGAPSGGTGGAPSGGTGGTATGGTTAPSGYDLNESRCNTAGVAALFPYAIPEASWTTVDLTPAGGMQAILDQLQRLRTEDTNHPVRLRLAPGFYQTRDAGQGEIYVMGLNRPAAAPVLIQASNPAPDATRLGQSFNLVGVSYLAFDGLTIGPGTVGAFQMRGPCDVDGNCSHAEPKPLVAQAGFHISGTAIAPQTSGLTGGHLNYAVYGRYLPSHHIVIRRVTIQNVFDDAEVSGARAEGGGSDGIKFNQASDVWVVESSIRQVSRHGIDNVGVHGACYLGNVIAQTGQGLGIEAKGGAVDVTFDSNVFYDVRRMEIGGELTDATYYWSAETPGTAEHYNYEARRLVARNNVIIDAREGGLEFSGCHDCSVVNNTIIYTPTFDRSFGGGDALREVDSWVNRDGAGTDCTPLDGDGIEVCWGVGPYPTDLVPTPGENGTSRTFTNARNALLNNLFLSPAGLWGDELNPYNHPDATHSHGLTNVDYNYWWNGSTPMTNPGDGSWLADGAHSVYTGPVPNPTPGLGSLTLDLSTPQTAASTARANLRPAAGSPLLGKALGSAPGYAPHDGNGSARPAPPAIGALEM